MAVAEDADAPVFPECPTYGFTVEPRYLVKVVSREGGFERRDRKWQYPLHNYTAVPMGERADEDAFNVVNFWHAIGGMSTLFRFKDYSDYRSAIHRVAITALDQPFTVISGSPGGYQLLKAYTYGSFTQYRYITKPIGSTILVANQSGVVQATSTYTVEEATGLVVPNGGFSGTPTSWGGEFYVPVRFASELQVELTNFRVQRISFQLVEVRIPQL